MGEYARVKGTGAEVKIGTCEDMLYLRADQAGDVWPIPGSLDPIRNRDGIRFRFPWPDEDGTGPGNFDDPFRRRVVHGVAHPDGIEHRSLQFKHDHGYLVSIPCPEGPEADHGLTIHRNGFKGSLFISQQRWWEGQLVTVCECACGAKYRLETLAMAEPIIVALRAEADHEADETNRFGSPKTAATLHAIADRIAAGYVLGLAELAEVEG